MEMVTLSILKQNIDDGMKQEVERIQVSFRDGSVGAEADAPS
jgi:hypothetical protein